MPARTRKIPEYRPSEAVVQTQIVNHLRSLGYIVKEVSVKKNVTGAYGSDKGIADILVTSERWPPMTWLPIEVKPPHLVHQDSKITMEQKDMIEMKRYALASTPDEAEDIVSWFEINVIATWRRQHDSDKGWNYGVATDRALEIHDWLKKQFLRFRSIIPK